MNKFMTKIALVVSSLVLVSACQTPVKPANTVINVVDNAPKNIIMIVGDGMGPAYTSAFRYFSDNPNTAAIEETVFDRLLVGRATTYPAPISGYVTDSAAAGTALATGHKTYNGAIGVNPNKEAVQSVLEYAKSIGKATGLVVTSQINHATPASYAAHVESRKMYNAIADQYIDQKINGQFKVDVMFGGGWQYFIRDDRDITKEFVNANYQYIDSYNELSSINSDKVLGLFGKVGLPWALDDSQPHRLKRMTVAAIDRLDNHQNGFFMLIEGSQIDWAGHSNDIAAAMAEMADLSATVEWLEDYVAQHPVTLVIMTADHSTGGFTIGANGKYAWNPQFIKNLTASPSTIAKTQITGGFSANKLSQQLGFDLTTTEADTLKAAHDKGDVKTLYIAIKHLLDIRTNTGWTTGGHTAVDVPVFAFGSNKALFSGQIDNTDIAKTIFKLLGK